MAIKLTAYCLDAGQKYLFKRGIEFTSEGNSYNYFDKPDLSARMYLFEEIPLLIEALRSAPHPCRRNHPNQNLLEHTRIVIQSDDNPAVEVDYEDPITSISEATMFRPRYEIVDVIHHEKETEEIERKKLQPEADKEVADVDEKQPEAEGTEE
jgi:hypothetical protein